MSELKRCPFCGDEVEIAPTGLYHWKYAIRHKSKTECILDANAFAIPYEEEDAVRMWNTRADRKDEPQTDWHYDEQDATWYPYKHEDEPQQKSCATCKHALGNWDGESNNCGRCCGADRRFYESIEDEPQTVETMSCAECKHRPIGAEICEEPCHYEPKDEQSGKESHLYGKSADSVIMDESQTDCAWK